MTARAFIAEQDPLRRGLSIWLGWDTEDAITQWLSDGTRVTMQRGEPAADTGPSLNLPDELARALLEALVRHYHGAEDTRHLRRDYEAERARVDRFISYLTRGSEEAG